MNYNWMVCELNLITNRQINDAKSLPSKQNRT